MESGVLTELQRQQYLRAGYLHLEQVIPQEILGSLQAVLERWADDMIDSWGVGRPTAGGSSSGDFSTKLYRAWLDAGSPELLIKNINDSLYAEDFFHLFYYEKLQEIAKTLLRTQDIGVHNGSFIRAKMPQQEYTTTPWHQDVQCMNDLTRLDFITVWIPLVDVHESNSCLQIAKYDPAEGMYKSRYHSDSRYVGMRKNDIEKLSEEKAIHMKRGDILCFNRFLPHRTLPNESPSVRWSLDLRYLKK